MIGAITLVLAFGPPTGPSAPFEDHSVVRVFPGDDAQLEHAREVSIDRWTETVRLDRGIDIEVDGDGLAALDQAGIAYEVVLSDLAGSVEGERTRIGENPLLPDFSNFFDEYRSLAEIEAQVDAWAADYPERVIVDEVGASLDGRMIRAVRIRNANTPPDAPVIVLNGLQHAREWIGGAVAMCMAEAFIVGSGDPDIDADIEAILDQRQLIVLPVVNPDGYEFSWSDQRFWRKNTRPPYGVDLNRNWAAGWGVEPGSDSDPESPSYRGTGPFSEPETEAIATYLFGFESVLAHVDFHAYGELVLWPFSFTEEETEVDELTLASWANTLKERINETHGENYQAIAGTDFYPASGTMPDWSVDGLGAVGFTIELRPHFDDADDFEGGFMLPPEVIRPTCDESLAAAVALGKLTLGDDPEPPPDPSEEGGADEGEGTGDGGTESGGGEGELDGGVEPEDTGTGGGEETGGGASTQDAGCSCSAPRHTGTGRTALWSLLGLTILYRRRRRPWDRSADTAS